MTNPGFRCTIRAMPRESKPIGRPSLYSEELAGIICAGIADGTPLAEICRSEGYPAARTVREWQETRPEFSAAIAHARDLGHDAIAENARLTARGVAPHSSNDVQRDKLIVETDLKLLAKWNPKKYGDKIQTEHSGSVSMGIAETLRARRAKRTGQRGPDSWMA